MKTFNEYQDFTESLAVYNTEASLFSQGGTHEVFIPYLYPVLALAEEAGEVAGKVAKYVRKSAALDVDHDDSEFRLAVAKELGDVAYQLSETARQFGFTLQDIIDMNVAKLTDRKDRNVLVGEGDER